MAKFKPGVLVVQNKPSLPQDALQENWPQPSGNISTSITPHPPLGLIVSEFIGNRISVAWFQPSPVEAIDDWASRVVVQRTTEDGTETGQEFIFASQIRKHTMDSDVSLHIKYTLSARRIRYLFSLCSLYLN